MKELKKRGKKSLNGNGTSKTYRFRCSDELHAYGLKQGPEWARNHLTQKMKDENGKNV